MMGSEGGPQLRLQRGPRWPRHVIFSGVGDGANQVRSWQTLLCEVLFIFFSVSFNHPDHRMLGGLRSLVWAFFSPLCIFCLTSPCPTGSVSFCAGIAGPGLRCFPRVFSSCEQGLLFSFGEQASHCSGFSCCGAQTPGTWASVTAGHRLSCPMAYGIFLDHQISNPCLLRWQVNSFPLAPRGSPVLSSFYFLIEV